MIRTIAYAASRQLRGPALASAAYVDRRAAAVVARTARRMFHSSPISRGWNQHVAFGVGLPLKIEDAAIIESVAEPSARITRVVVNECIRQLRVEVHSGGLMLDADRCSKWVQHDHAKHGRVLVFDRNLHWIEQYQFVLPEDELIGPFDTFDKLAEAIGLNPEEAAAAWTRYEAAAMGSLEFETALGLSRTEEDRREYPYCWWAAAANVWAD